MIIFELASRLEFWKTSDRIGPDIAGNHYRLYFKKSARRLCRKKFKYFGEGAEFRPGAYAFACSKISIGKNVVIRPNTMLFADNTSDGAEIIIEDFVLIGSGVHIYVSNHRFDNPEEPIYFQGHNKSKPVIIYSGAWIGANAIILPGVTIGRNSVIGAGSIVTKDVPDFTVAVGNPAKVIKYLK